MRTNLEILSDFPNESLEGQLPDEKLGRFLVLPNFTKSDSSGTETMGFLDASSSGTLVNEIDKDVKQMRL
jgi:hypothetical protein